MFPEPDVDKLKKNKKRTKQICSHSTCEICDCPPDDLSPSHTGDIQLGSDICHPTREAVFSQSDKSQPAEGNAIGVAVAGVETKPSKEGAQTEFVPRKHRERRNKLSTAALSLALMETFVAPLSPASSSSASQGNSSADVTFAPTIEMMVNDFDDEQTLNEEEALAAQEQQDPQDEIDTLKEESEMPLEELLAKYRVMPPAPFEPARKRARRTPGSKQAKAKRSTGDSPAPNADESNAGDAPDNIESDVIVIESGDEEAVVSNWEAADDEMHATGRTEASATPILTVALDETEENDNCVADTEKTKSHRSHLLDLYPDQSFTAVLGADVQKDGSLEALYDEDEEDEDEADETDSDYVKKTIMVGSSYQATIPDGLSQYGDVLPYENEDKLIWEPSQVSERQVEEYLLRARDIKPNLLDNDDETVENGLKDASTALDIAAGSKLSCGIANNGLPNADPDIAPQSSIDEIKATAGAPNVDNDSSGVIKDNEQALHLLVQCGYDFKEALRRKRLNALPLTGSMSLWSEEECTKFEEGIQKFGKDFLKIRQIQVRTRTMRELVQFYYLWKKSDRRDHNFANSDTVDHMDIYLNEGGDYSPNASNGTASTGAAAGGATAGAPALGTRKNSGGSQKNFSIMMTGNSAGSTASSQLSATTAKSPNSRKRVSAVTVAGAALLTPNNNNDTSTAQSISLSAPYTK